ncbi:unnamed protein product [Mesocestoides corti]|uniref:Inositol hexakisphosphate and diphosphoinositol-pentakisphosphate kinase n=1 Tax=Mesocestoides corti TaxID=53468 RepID=A0A0R3U666_MESCO|nr:unnamed protein product [Mesocestoides corti]
MHDSLSEDGNVFISLGVCAMAKKTKSKPMKEILRRLVKFQHIRVIVFEERMILKQPIEAWPVCDALISFYSDGFPLQKAIAYSKLRRPYLVNDLEAQYVLMDRKRVYECLQSEGIPVPRYACVERSDPKNPVNVIEHDDAIEIDGEVFHKPFVEKPLNAEDHNIYIYFPSSAGGGSQRLFRKVGDRSSKYFQISTIRTEGSYLYEEFMPTDGTDVKVYTVADDYAHAEARKSPALDGKVERDSEGKEIRYPVILTPREKIIAKKVAKVVKQQICGFDLLRANGMSYVCDVNGFSFVKTSRKYYDDCSHVLGVLITRVIAPRLCPTGMGPWITPGTDDDIPLVPTTCGTIMELRCVIAVFRHGDRTPKQKMKMDVRDERFFKLFKKYAGERTLELKLKKPTQLQEVLDIVRDILDDIESGKLKNSELEEKKAKFEQLRYVLEMYGSFSGINRKIQLKYQPNGRVVSTCKKKESGKNGTEDKNSVSLGDKLNRSRSGKSTTPSQGKGLLTAGREENEVDNVQSPDAAVCSSGATVDGDPCILLVVKWGGELTAAGRQQAEDLGRAFRCIYPGGDGNYGKNPGLGLLRLHSTYRHDLKIYASDEGRVQMTAAAFAKGFLALEGELPPILVQMVKSANTNGLLDNDNDCHQYQQMVKKRIKKVMAYKGVWGEEHRQALAPTGAKSLLNAMDFVRNPTEACAKLFGYVQRLANRVAMMTANPRERAKVALYHNESWDLLLRRWGKLVKDFRSPSGDYDVSKLPDIYDNIKYDIQHNSGILIESEMLDFFSLARALADIVVPQEYGITKEEKLVISQRICTPLLRKILSDARYTDVDECTRLHAGYSKGVASPERFVRTRLYFTSESHLHSILTCLQHGGLADAATDEQWKRAMDYVSTVPELNYLSQVVIMIYEDPTVEPKTEKKFHVELHFSPGAHALCRDLPAGSGFRPGRRETSLLSSSTSLAETSFDSASEQTGVDGTLTHSSPTSAATFSQGHKKAALPSRSPNSRAQVISKQCFSACRSLCIDRSLPADLHEVGRATESSATSACAQPPARSHADKHRKNVRISRQTSVVYRPPALQSGLCYADVVNQDAVLGHRSRMQELWLENTRNLHRQSQRVLKKGTERSMSTGPMVEHASTSPSILTSENNSSWHDKTLTTVCKPMQRALNSDGDNVLATRLIPPHFSQTRGRFTVTSPHLDLPEISALKPPTSTAQWNPWYTDTMDLEDDDDIETTGEPEVSTSHSTLDLAVVNPSASSPRHFSATTPGSPVKWMCQNRGSPPCLVNAPVARRLSFGDKPQEFCTLQSKSSCLGGEDASVTAQVYTSLDSVKPDRAQELLDQGVPVAQWLMEYFEQIEKAKWSKGGETSEVDLEVVDSPKQANYKPILSAADYLTADLSMIPKPLSSNDTRRGSVDQMIAPTEMSEEGTVTNTEESHASMRSHGGSEVPPKPGEGSRGSVIPSQGSSAYFPERPTDAAANVSVNDIVARELNALTYPNRQVQIDLKGEDAHFLNLNQLRALTQGDQLIWALGPLYRLRDMSFPEFQLHSLLKIVYYLPENLNSPCPTRRVRGLISTAVIRGSRDTYSSSVPDLIQLLNCSDSGGHSQVETPQNPSDLMVPSAPSVPEIYPLETLHNAMTLHQLESFFARLTTTKFPSPFTSPRLSSAGGALPPTERTNMAVNEAPNTRYMNIITPTTFTNDADDRATSAAGEPQSKASWLISRRVERRSLSEPGATIATPNGSPGTAELKPLVKTGSFSSRKDDSVAMSATASPM